MIKQSKRLVGFESEFYLCPYPQLTERDIIRMRIEIIEVLGNVRNFVSQRIITSKVLLMDELRKKK